MMGTTPNFSCHKKTILHKYINLFKYLLTHSTMIEIKNNQYKLTGTGSTIEKADQALDKDKTKLISKLEQGKANTDLNITNQIYLGKYNLAKGQEKDGGTYLSEFSVKTDKGWDNLIEKAENHSNSRKYDGTFTREEYVTLTAIQKKAFLGKKESRRSAPSCSLENTVGEGFKF